MKLVFKDPPRGSGGVKARLKAAKRAEADRLNDLKTAIASEWRFARAPGLRLFSVVL